MTAHAGTIASVVDLEALTALHDWMRERNVTECSVGGTRLVLGPIERPISLTSEPPMSKEQEIEQEVRDLLWSSGSEAEAVLEMQRRTDELLKKRSAA